MLFCCGAKKNVDAANYFSCFVSKLTAGKQWREQRRNNSNNK